MILSSPGAVAFEIFGFAVYWYGIIMAFAVLLGTFVADFVFKKFFPVDSNSFIIIDIMPMLMFVGFLGARVYYCLVNHVYYTEHPLEIFYFRQGGLSIHGMLIFSVIFLFFYLRYKKISFFDVAASLCLGLSIGQVIGRWGNFFNSEAFGKPCDFFIKLYIQPHLRPDIYKNVEFFHPTFLYESLLDFLIFLVLAYLLKLNKFSSMFIVGMYLFLYSVVRIIIEFIRVDSIAFLFGIPIAVFVSLICLCFSIVLISLALIKKFR